MIKFSLSITSAVLRVIFTESKTFYFNANCSRRPFNKSDDILQTCFSYHSYKIRKLNYFLLWYVYSADVTSVVLCYMEVYIYVGF